MSQPASYDYIRYLAAKREIDARSMNLRVWQQFVEALHKQGNPIRILEVGAGIGATAERILSAASQSDVHYTLVDRSRVSMERAQDSLHRWARDAGYELHARKGVLHAQRPERRLHLRFVAADVFDFAATTEEKWDVLVAQAFLDLVNLQQSFSCLSRLLVPAALLYMPIHFDGLTVFEPVEAPSVHQRIVQAYHDTMDERETPQGPSGGSQAGRSLITAMRQFDARLLAAGSSDWVIAATEDGFSSDEMYFLHHMLHFVETSLQGHPSVARDELQVWLQRRRRQIEENTLVFIAHQIDVLARWKP